MKSLATLALLASSLLAVPVLPAAETTPFASADARNVHRVVFELTSAETEAWNAVLNNIENVRKSLGENATKVELGAHAPGEANDLGRSEPQKVATLRAELKGWQKSIKARFPTPNPAYDPQQPSGRVSVRPNEKGSPPAGGDAPAQKTKAKK